MSYFLVCGEEEVDLPIQFQFSFRNLSCELKKDRHREFVVQVPALDVTGLGHGEPRIKTYEASVGDPKPQRVFFRGDIRIKDDLSRVKSALRLGKVRVHMGRSVAQLQASVHDIPVSGIDTDILRLAVHCLETSQIGDPEPSVRFDLTYDTAKRIQVGCKDQGLPFSADFGENAPLPGNGGMESHFLQGILCVFRDFSRKTGRTVD